MLRQTEIKNYSHGAALQKKSSFRLSVSSVNVTKSADSVTFTKEILNGILDFLCSAPYSVLEASHRYPAFYKKVLHDF